MPTSGSDLDYLAHVASESTRFAHVLAGTAGDAPVPPCPDWNADDLLWHLSLVQWFWGTIVTNGALTENQMDEIDNARPERPATRAGLADFFAASSRTLLDILTVTAPDTPVWTWADDRSVGFVRRRQAHEALIHRIDAELTAGDRTGMDPRLSADGVDEALRIMYRGDVPAWGKFAARDDQTLRIRPTDTPDSWLVALGQFTGTDPDDGNQYDQAGIQVAADDPAVPAAATVSGTAADLDCWLWGRPTEAGLDRAGDAAALAAFDAMIAEGIT